MKLLGAIYFIIILILPVSIHAQEENAAFFTGKYFLSNGAISLDKSESLVVWNLFGPQYYRGLTKNIQVGITSYWLLTPIVLESQVSMEVVDYIHIAGGGMYGLNWVGDENDPVAVLFGTITLGDKNANISNSIYRFDFEDSFIGEEVAYNPREYTVLNISAYYKTKRNAAFVADLFYTSRRGDTGILVMYGAQILTKRNRFFNVGFMNYHNENKEFYFIPIPFLQLQVPVN